MILYKMLPLLLLNLVVSSVNSAGIVSLMDLPLTMAKGNYMIHATLTDAINGNKYFMQEYISSNETIKGKIIVNTPKSSFNVHYHLTDQSGNDNYERLITRGNNCTLYKSTTPASTRRLPGIGKRLTSLLLSMGPSILYRIDHGSLIWMSSADENVRGSMMKSFTTTISKIGKLSITYYYKSNLDQQSGLQQPSRIVFSGTDPSYFGSTAKETLILDIYLQEKDLQNDFSLVVHPTPGIGCPVYYEPDLPIPIINTHLIHMILSETIEGPTTTKTISEIYAYDKLKLLRLKTSILGLETEALYDYSLGVVNLFQDGGSCNILLAELGSPGIDPNSGRFSLSKLFSLDGKFNYLGKLYLENRPGFVVKAWESIQYDAITPNGKYDKIVVTQYFTETTSTDVFNGHMIVSTTINCYKLKGSKNNYQLVETIKRDYMDLQVSETESEFHDKFTLAGCNYFTSEMTLTFQLACTGSNCIKFAEDHVYELKERFKNSILLNYDLTPLRLSELDINFHSSSIDIRIDILEAPNLQNVFAPKTMFVSEETLELLARTASTNELDCINRISNNYANFDVVLYCPTKNICGTMNGIKNVKRDDMKGEACQVIQVPLHNLHRLNREIANKNLQSNLIRDTVYKTITLHRDNHEPLSYRVVDIIDETRDKSDPKKLYSLSYYGASLHDDDENVVLVPEVTFGDCYRACANSNELECRTFSFCSNVKSTKCLITNMTSDQSHVYNNNDPSCSVYVKNHLLDYSIVQNRRYKVPKSISKELSVDKCASQCSTQKDCFSFQSCGQTCILSGHYTDSSTEYNVDCKIYVPKVLEKYQATGRNLVSDTFHVEFNLNLNQCAALCHNWADEGNSCQSFNFCPQGRSTSTCSLSKYVVANSRTTTAKGNCFNYELTNSNGDKKSKQSTAASVKVTSGSAAFGIIFIFLASGLLFGIGLPIVYSKVNSLKSWSPRSTRNDQSFTWTRQVDVQSE